MIPDGSILVCPNCNSSDGVFYTYVESSELRIADSHGLEVSVVVS